MNRDSNTLTLTTLFENDAILAVSKPSLIPSHSLSDSTQVTVESTLKKNRSDLQDLHLLHRLDTGTSGVLMFAKNHSTYVKMREKFKLKKIGKFYRAWSQGPEEKNELPLSLHPIFENLPLTLNLSLAHHPKSKKRMIIIPVDRKVSFRGKPFPALSIIHDVKEKSDPETLKLWNVEKPLFEFEVEIKTGVTHQIRVHLSHIAFPLIGDPIYGKKNAQSQNDAISSPTRLGLHAERVSFELDGTHYEIEDRTFLKSSL